LRPTIFEVVSCIEDVRASVEQGTFYRRTALHSEGGKEFRVSSGHAQNFKTRPTRLAK